MNRKAAVLLNGKLMGLFKEKKARETNVQRLIDEGAPKSIIKAQESHLASVTEEYKEAGRRLAAMLEADNDEENERKLEEFETERTEL